MLKSASNIWRRRNASNLRSNGFARESEYPASIPTNVLDTMLRYDKSDRRAISLVAKTPCQAGPVQNLVAFSTKRDQVGLRVITKNVAPSNMVNMEILGASALLNSATVTPQDLSFAIRHIAQAAFEFTPSLRSRTIHVALLSVEAGCSEAVDE